MDTARIAELLIPFLAENEKPTQVLLSDISTYIDILLRWNARVNLTAIRDPEQIVTRHFGESLFAARHLFPDRAATDPPVRPPEQSPAAARACLSPELEGQVQPARIRNESGRALLQGRDATPERNGASAPLSLADVGSGAGFPGIPIKLWAPEICVTLIESNYKKATFLREVARSLTLTDINIQTTRAETLSPATFDLVTLRAVERFERVLPSAAALLKPDGRLTLLIASAQVTQARSILREYLFNDPIPLPLSRTRVLLISVPGTVLPESGL